MKNDLKQMVDFFTKTGMVNYPSLCEKHNTLVDAYKEHGFYNHENPVMLYKKLMTQLVEIM